MHYKRGVTYEEISAQKPLIPNHTVWMVLPTYNFKSVRLHFNEH